MFEKKGEFAMHSRGGFPVKNVLYVLFVLVLIYVMYLYNGSKNQLTEVEMQVERYRREASERITEIQDLIKSKDQLQETFQQEKHEGNNRFNSIKQQHSMLQSQFKETEADFLKLKNDMENMKSEHMQAESQHATEYQQYKQQKEMEISDLKDQIANTNQHNEELSKSITDLQLQVQNLQAEKQMMKDQNEQLQQQLQATQIQLNQVQLSQNNAIANNNNNNNNIPAQGAAYNHRGLVNMKIPLGNNILQNKMKSGKSLSEDHAETHVKDVKKTAPQLNDELNAAHQVKPPSNNDDDLNKDELKKDDLNPDSAVDNKDEPNVKPNDEKMAQIQEPNFDNGDQQEGGGEAGAKGVNVGDVEDARAKNAEDEEEEQEEQEGVALNKPLHPLALGQMRESQGFGQQGAPLMNDKDENDLNNNKDEAYVDEGDDNDLQQRDENENNIEDEDEEAEEEEEDNLENLHAKMNDDNFERDIGNRGA